MENPRSDLPKSAPSKEQTHPLDGVVAGFRRVAFILLLAGVGGSAVWYGNVRLSRAPGGSFTTVAVGIIAGTLLLAAALTVVAFILDLLICVNASKTTHHGDAESRPLTTV